MKRLALAAMLGALAFALPAQADTTVKWLHIASNPAEAAMMQSAADEYMSGNPGIKVELQYLENEAFKSKLTTLLQSPDAPDIFYSWGGGVLEEQVKSGVLREVGDVLTPDYQKEVGPAGINAFTVNGKLYGIAQHVSEVTFWYNKALFKQADLDPAIMNTWDGFLAGVKKLKAAGITPIALGGGDKWPAHFYWAYLAVRMGGQKAFDAARSGQGDGFMAQPFIDAGNKLLELAALKPFQDGFQSTVHLEQEGIFGDGKAAMMLMGDWAYATQASEAADGKGIPDDNLGSIPFPSIPDGAGDPSDTFGGINGWIFSKNASDEAVKFMQWYESKPYMSKAAAAGYFIPIVAGAADALVNPFQKQIALDVAKAHWHAIFFDQVLGPNVGGVVNDVAEELAEGAITAEDAAKQVQQAFKDSH